MRELPLLLVLIVGTIAEGITWRSDGHCGAQFPLENGKASECDPSGQHPCCSPKGWCGSTSNHCTCNGCKDYRVLGQRSQGSGRAETNRAWSTPDQPSQSGPGVNAWSQPAGAPGPQGAWSSGGPRAGLDDQIVRGPGHRGPVSPGNSPVPSNSQPTSIDSRVTNLESSVNEIKGTLDLLLNWLCEIPEESNAKVVPGKTGRRTLACNRRKKAVVEEASVAQNVDQVDRARTRTHSTGDDGWSTVGGAAKPRAPTGGRGPSVASGPINTADLQAFTEDLIQKDINNVAPQLRINRQGQTNSRAVNDLAQGPLVTIPSSALNGPTIMAFRALLDNYNPNVKVRDGASNAEVLEQNNFLNEIMNTQVMKTTEAFLTAKGKIRRPLVDVLKEIWFTMYRRSGNIEGSSGFEHSFIGEIKDGKVSGFHNWIQFAHEEDDGDLDYKGFMKYVNLGNKGQVVKLRFNWLSDVKPVGSLFIGTSPELEMALYTVCFLVKPDQQCQVKLNKKKFNIQTWTQNYKGKKLIGSAYPDI